MANAMVKQESILAQQIEQVVVGGDLNALTAPQRVMYYNRVCESVGLNPYTRPFEYLRLNGKLVLYARRDAADQLRGIHGISLSKPTIEYVDDLIIVTVEAVNKNGRTDTDLGAVSIKGLQGEAKANAMLKAITKAKRRVTLSLAGLGWLDETEVDSIPGAQRVAVDIETGEIVDAPQNAPRNAQDAPERVEAISVADSPYNDTPPTLDELAIIKQWSNRTEAEMWAVMTGACENEYEANNSMNKSIARCGGKVTMDSYKCIYIDFLRRQQEKLQEKAQVAEPVA